MNKLVKSVLSLPLLFGLMLTAGCELGGDLGGLVGGMPQDSASGNNGQLDQATQLNQIYELAKAQGYEGTYEEWLDSLKGDQIELRVSSDGKYIQWRYSSASYWQNLIPLSDITGESGQDGKDGLDGKDGQDGKDGLDGKDGQDGIDGEDGLTPHVGENGNWWIGEEDTGISAHGKGDAGEDGQDGITPTIGENGNWWLGDTDTGVKAEAQGEKGDTGKSAYEAFLETHPEYTGNESQWLEDLLNGKLSESNYKYYDVKFNLAGGEFPTIDYDLEQQILATHAIEAPTENPTKAGFIFAGWYVGNEKWNFDTSVVIKNLVIKARWVKADVDPRVDINNVRSDSDSVLFDLYVDNISEVDAIALYRYGELVQTLDNLDERQFDGLYSNQEYRVQVTFSYDLNDGYGRQTKTVDSWIWTQPKQNPMFYFENVSSTTESISFKVNEYDPDEAAKFISYELYLNGEKVAESFNYEEASFNDLLANKDYYLRVNYECDMNDLSQPYTNYAEYYVHTLELFAPVVTLNNQLATQNAITGQIIINDVSKINNLLYVNLYKDGVLVETSESLDLNYTNLDHNTKYTIVVVHQYDLRDGNGLVTKEVSFDVTTHPIYSLTGTEILNTSAIVEGELVYIHAEVDNPSNATFKKIYINDKEYEVDPASTSTHVFAYIPSVELGETEFTVNKLIATIDGSDFEYYAENNNTATATVYNKLSIDSIEYVDKDFNVRNYFFEDEERYIKFNLVNPNGYSLTSVKFNEFEYKAEDLIYIDDNTYYAAFTYGYSDSHYRPTMNSFSYADSVVSRTTQTSLKAENVYILSNGFEKTYISSAEDLLAIADDYNNIWGYRYYELTQDIDLSGMEWIPVHIRGVLNGNGYSIKNMRIAKTYENSRADIGLISNLEGVLCNLTLDSSIIMVEFKDQPNDTSYVGGLVAHSYYSVIDNCHVLNNSSLSVNNTNSSRSGIDLGGLTGYAYYCDIKNSSNRSNISIKGYVASVGTIVGNSWYSYFVNVFNTGNLSYNNKSENILFCSESNTVVNCYNTGLLNGNNDVSLFNNYNTSKNCINLAKKYPNQVIDFENVKTYTLETNGGNSLSSVEGVIVTLPTPTKEGYYFLGWYENEEFDGKPNSGVYFNNEDITLYAKWAKIIDFSSEMITNDTNHPFEFRNGVLTSTIHERTEYADYTYASYEIKADRNIRVYFKTENLSSSASHSSYWDEEKQLNYVDLSAGEYIKFEIWNYNEDRYAGYVYDLVILEM